MAPTTDSCERIEFDTVFEPLFPNPYPPLQLQLFRLQTAIAQAEGSIVDVLP